MWQFSGNSLTARHNPTANLFLPLGPFATRQGVLAFLHAQMLGLHPLGLGGSCVIPVLPAGLRNSAGFMHGCHVGLSVFSAKLQRTQMLYDETLTHAINLALAESADALVSLPYLEAHTRRHSLALSRSNVFNHYQNS